MTELYSEPVRRIVENYIGRLKARLKSLPEKDRAELVGEMYSHIYESFQEDPAENEIDRILNVLNRLGDPDRAASDWISSAMVRMGKRKRIPLYILGGLLLGIVGLPLGMTGAVILLSVALAVAMVVVLYYGLAVTLTVGGTVGILMTVLKWAAPGLAVRIGEILRLQPDFDLLPARLLLAMVMLGAGLGLLWGGKYLMRGLRFLLGSWLKKIKELKEKRKLKSMGLAA